MKLRRDLLISIGSLVALNLLVALGTVALLSRMGPAIERILLKNVTSIELAERMLGILAAGGGQPLSPEQRAVFVDALARAEANVSEPSEREVVARIRAQHEAALRGEAPAIASTVVALQGLVAVNRSAMREQDRMAQRMGTAGAWSAVFIGLLGFLASLAVMRRLRRYVLEPLAELYGTLEAARKGDRFRRCTASDAAPELKRILQMINQMLDQQERTTMHGSSTVTRHGHDSGGSARMALMYLLDQQPRPAFVIDGRGHLVAANRPGLDQLESTRGDGLRQQLARVPGGEHGAFDAVQLGDGESWYCELARARAESEIEPVLAGERPA